MKRNPAEGPREAQTARAALTGKITPLLRQFRKFAALKACADLLPGETSGLAAPFDVRLSPAQEQPDPAAPPAGDVSTMYIYVANATVAALLEQRKRALIKAVNARLPVAMVEELRFEVAPRKVERQLNILALTPD